MAKSPSRTPLIAAVILVLVTLAGFNALSEKYRPKSEHEMEAEAQKAQAEAAKNAPKTAPPTPSAAPQAATGDASASTTLAQWGPDKTLGNKGAKTTITVGWSWTPDVQGDPGKVMAGITALQKAAPDAQIRVVNTDAVLDVPDGVSVNGAVVIPPAADGGLPSDPAAYQVVGQASAGAKK